MKMNRTQNSLNNFEKVEHIQASNDSDFKAYCKVTIKKCIHNWQRDRHIDQWNRKETLEINLHVYGQLNFDKGTKAIQRKKDCIFNKMCWQKLDVKVQKVTVDP